MSSQTVVLCVGDPPYLDYGAILAKREGYGPQGNGGNGLLLHSALAIAPEQGQPLGWLWQKLWPRQHRAKPPADETPEQKKQRRAQARKAQRVRPVDDQESYRWGEAMSTAEQQVSPSTQGIDVFDREGDIAEVFDQLNTLSHPGVVIRAAHNRRLAQAPSRLWEKLAALKLLGCHAVTLSETKTRPARIAKLAIRFGPVQLRSPARLGTERPLPVRAVYADEVDCPEGAEPVSWMLLTREPGTTLEQAQTILRWYTYRWRGEAYHKILKSGGQSVPFHLAAEGMKS